MTTEDEEELHVTLIYLGNAVDYDVPHVMAVVRGWASSNPTMAGRLAGIGTFDNPNSKVLWASVNIPGLEDAHVSLRAALEFSGVKINHVNGFTPHATLSYSEKPFTEMPPLPEAAMEEFSVGSVWVVAGPDWNEVSLAAVSAKVDPIDAVPQERLTSITRGRGPRRGNLEALLDYWRPIMKKPGGFRRCLVILADHPELYPLEPMCAWLHHETTGKWPNEGNRRSKKPSVGKRRVRRRRGKKTEMMDVTNAKRDSRERGGILTQPINGRDNVVAFKASLYRSMLAEQESVKVGFITSRSRTGRGLQSAGSLITPGDLGDIRHPVRSTIFETLTPGGGGGKRGRRRGLPKIGGDDAVKNKFRCPPGFEEGGTFTNSSFSTCGRQILDIPLEGPGSLSEVALKRIKRLAEDASLVRAIGDLRQNRSAFDIVRAAQIPAAPKEVNTKARQSSVDLIVDAFDGGKDVTESRFVRRDGIILRPAVSLSVLNELGEFDDMNDGVLVVSDDLREAGVQIGRDEVPAMVTGLRATVFHVPKAGSLSIRREGGDLKPVDRASIARSWAAALSAVGKNDDPTAAIRKFIEDSDGRYKLDQNLGEEDIDRELITVQRGKRKISVPRWVYATYLSDEAPRRPEGQTPYTLVGEDTAEEKAMSMFAIKSQVAVVSDPTEFYAPYFGAVKMRTSDLVRLSTEEKIGRPRGWWDPNIERFRCPAGTSGGGQITDRFARNCGASISGKLIKRLFKAGRDVGVDRPAARLDPASAPDGQPNVPGNKPSTGGGDSRQFIESMTQAGHDVGQIRENLNQIMGKLGGAVDAAKKGKGKRGRIGATLGDRQERVSLSPEQTSALNGREFAESLNGLADLLDEPLYDEAPIELARELYHDIEKAATLEAGRQEAVPARNREGLRVRGEIDNALGRLIDRVAAPSKKKNGSGTPKGPNRRQRVFNRAADAFQQGDSNPVDPDTRDKPRIRDRIANIRADDGRRDLVPVPEAANLDAGKQERVRRAMLEEFEELDELWANRLGAVAGEDFTFAEIDDYISKLKGNPKKKPEIRKFERQRDDWAELHAGSDPEEDTDFEDILGRLAPSRREGIMRTADLNLSGTRERERQARLAREIQAEAETEKLAVDKDDRKIRRREAVRRVLSGGGKKEPVPEEVDLEPMVPFKEGYDRELLMKRPAHGFVFGEQVPVGNAGIDTAAQASAYLKEGGDLANVPDALLGKAIHDNSRGKDPRFKKTDSDGGVNGMDRFLDTKTGHKLGVKFGTGGKKGKAKGEINSAFNEVMGAHMGERLGFLQGQIRFDGPPDSGDTGTPVIVVDLAQNYVDGTVHGPRDMYNGRMHVDDSVRLTALDFISLNVDRHTGNFLQFEDTEGVSRIVPIDNGRGWNGVRKEGNGIRAGGDDSPMEEQWAEWAEYYRFSGAAAGLFPRGNRGQVERNRDDVIKAIEEMQETMRVADEKMSMGDALEGIYGATEHAPTAQNSGGDAAIRGAQDRHDWLLDADPEELYNMLEKAHKR